MAGKRDFGRIRKLPSGRWQARYPDASGAPRPAPDTFPTRGDAARLLAAVQADMARGSFIDPNAGKVTFDEWSVSWLEGDPRKRRTSKARDAAALKTWASPAIGSKQMAAITPLDIRRLVESMCATLAGSTVVRNLAVVRACFSVAVDADVIARSPVRGITLPRVAPPYRPVLTMDDVLRLAASTPDRYSTLILLGGVLGLRWGEAAGLRVCDIDFLRRQLTVAQEVSEVGGHLAIEPPKSERSLRTFSVPPFVIDALAAHLTAHRRRVDPSALIFVGPQGGMLRRRFAERVFSPAVKAAGLDSRLTFHGLRHVAATLMVEAGEHPRVIQHRLGHATPHLSMGLYAHVPESADREAARHLEEMVQRVRAPEALSG